MVCLFQGIEFRVGAQLGCSTCTVGLLIVIGLRADLKFLCKSRHACFFWYGEWNYSARYDVRVSIFFESAQ